MQTKDTHHLSSSPSLIQTIFRILLGATLLFTGTAHLTFARKEFQAQVPEWVPLSDNFVVVASGIVELLLGASVALMRGRFRVFTGWLTAAFFVAIFPGNISQYRNRVHAFGLDSDRARLVRLFFQPLLVLWALWSTDAWQPWRRGQ